MGLKKDARLELGPTSRELLVSRNRRLVLEFERRKFCGADVVSGLREAVVGRRGRTMSDGVLGESVVDGLMQMSEG